MGGLAPRRRGSSIAFAPPAEEAGFLNMNNRILALLSAIGVLWLLYVALPRSAGVENPADYYAAPVRKGVDLSVVKERNRLSLKAAPHWMDSDQVYRGALFLYGLPESVRHLIDKDVGPTTTIPDLLGFLLTRLEKKPRYLEIGVSVGKCLYQMLHILGPSSVVTAFDLESINPAFEGTLTQKKALTSWVPEKRPVPQNENQPLVRGGLKCGVDVYKGPNNQPHYYVTSDEWDEEGWKQLAGIGINYNLIYSDAMHVPHALTWEWKQIKERNLLAFEEETWFMVWDDLHSGLTSGFDEITKDAAAQGSQVHYRTFSVYGWLGQNEGPHTVGVLSNRNLDFIQQALSAAS